MSDAGSLNRAEAVRRRRREQAQRREAQSSRLASRPLAPIISRSMPAVQSAPQRVRHGNAGRRYQNALSMPGIEVRLPAIQFTSSSLQWRLASLAISGVLAASLYFAWNGPMFRTAPAQVSGNVWLGAEEIRTVLGVEGRPIFALVPSELETRLRMNYPEVLSADITPGLPNVLTVQVVERRPLISWRQGDGYTWIDAGGVAFRPRGQAENLIAVHASAAPPAGRPSPEDALAPVPYMSLELVGAIQALAASVPAGATMAYDPRYGLGWADSRGWQVFFGSEASEMKLKLEVYESLVNSLASEGIVPAFISVQYANAPYYRVGK